MSSPIRRAVIRAIAERRRVSLAVAAHIYSLKSIKEKQRLCDAEQRRQLQFKESQP